MNNTLFNIDCISKMQSMPDNSIDLIVTDPPYNIGFNASHNMENIDWDKRSDEEFYNFNKAWMSEAFRILKLTGTMWMFTGPTKIPEIFKVVEEVGFTNHLENWTIYARGKGRGSSKKLKSLREDILHLTKDPKKFTWHSVEYLREVVAPFVKDGKPRGWVLDQATGMRVRWTGAGNVCFFTAPTFNSISEPQIHSCQKPVLMMAELIMYSSDKGETVFDPFMGSGSTAIAASLVDRNFIGCEQETDMFKKAENWINTFNDKTTRLRKGYEEYTAKHLSSDEKNFKFGFDKREIMPK